VLGNAAGNPRINLVAIAVGNGCVGLNYGLCSFDAGVEINTNVPYFRGHSLISSTTYDKFTADCPVGTDPSNPSAACQADIAQAHAEVGNVNIYDIYADCVTGPNTRVMPPRIDAATGAPVYWRAPVPVREGGPVGEWRGGDVAGGTKVGAWGRTPRGVMGGRHESAGTRAAQGGGDRPWAAWRSILSGGSRR
jgi:hypothetical protein